jgi:hypothetical protein
VKKGEEGRKEGREEERKRGRPVRDPYGLDFGKHHAGAATAGSRRLEGCHSCDMQEGRLRRRVYRCTTN